MSGTGPFNEAARWLRFAREDLATAVALRGEEVFVPRQVCRLAQQAAEKAIKAALVRLQLESPRTHDLDLLLNLLPDRSNARRPPEANWHGPLTELRARATGQNPSFSPRRGGG